MFMQTQDMGRTPGANLPEILVVQRTKDDALGAEVLYEFYLNVSISLFFLDWQKGN